MDKKAKLVERIPQPHMNVPGHEPFCCGIFMSDWVECSCGWKSNEYFDGMPYAISEWHKHSRDH